MQQQKTKTHWRVKLHEIIYEADTPAGKFFDVVLLITIVFSIVLVMLESIKSFDLKYHRFIYFSEWVITILFTIEYITRIITVKRPWKYIKSFYGVIDLLSTIPMYLSFIFAGTNMLIALRALRLLRIFRILKLARYLGASQHLSKALNASRAKISVFLFAVLIACVIFGTLMYMVEGEENGFTNIPKSVYWCIVTLTTVGFGDIAPVTPLGQFIAAVIMIMGYGIIAVPTGIVTAEYSSATKKKDPNVPEPVEIPMNTQSCQNCNAEKHKDDANYCYQCGNNLHYD